MLNINFSIKNAYSSSSNVLAKNDNESSFSSSSPQNEAISSGEGNEEEVAKIDYPKFPSGDSRIVGIEARRSKLLVRPIAKNPTASNLMAASTNTSDQISSKTATTGGSLPGYIAEKKHQSVGSLTHNPLIAHPYDSVEKELREQQEKLKKHKLEYFLGRDLCPAHVSLRHTPQEKPQIQDCETYFRSELNPFTKHLKNNNKLTIYSENDSKVKKVKKEQGWQAHIGNYKNFMHELEQDSASFQSLGSKCPTSHGDASLYNLFINDKNSRCKYISDSTSGKTKYINVGYYFDYGCLMVHVKDESCFGRLTDGRKGKQTKAWTNLMISYFTALVNFHCYNDGFPIELERRGGFGCVTPTVADTGCSFRINLGITPIEFAKIITKCLVILDKSLGAIEKSSTPDITKTIYASTEHLAYLKKELYRVGLYENKNRELYNVLYNREKNELFYKKINQESYKLIKIKQDTKLLAKRKYAKSDIKDLDNPKKPIEENINDLHKTDRKYLNKILPKCLPSVDNNTVEINNNITSWFDFLWTPVEKDGSLFLESLTRTPYSRIILSQELFKKFRLSKSYDDSSTNKQFFLTIQQLAQNFLIENDHLSLQQKIEITKAPPIRSKSIKINDDQFWNLINHLISALKSSSIAKDVAVITNCLKYYYNEKVIDDKFYATFEALNELIFIAALNSCNNENEQYGDGYGSDSEEEWDIRSESTSVKEKGFAKKIITHNGMRAITLAIKAMAEWDDNVWMDKAYYEVPLGLKILNTLAELKINVEENRSEANIILLDANPCITNSDKVMVNQPFDDNDGAKVVIIDITSSSVEQCNTYVELFKKSRSPVMIFVESGAKHQQFFTKNQYGVIRIFAKNKDKLEKIYKSIKSFKEPIFSKTSHKFRRLMKELGMTFTNNSIISAASDKSASIT